MPQIDLLEAHRILMRHVRQPRPVRDISRSVRGHLRHLYNAEYVAIAFDWQGFETIAWLTKAGADRLERDEAANFTRL